MKVSYNVKRIVAFFVISILLLSFSTCSFFHPPIGTWVSEELGMILNFNGMIAHGYMVIENISYKIELDMTTGGRIIIKHYEEGVPFWQKERILEGEFCLRGQEKRTLTVPRSTRRGNNPEHLVGSFVFTRFHEVEESEEEGDALSHSLE